MPLVWFNAEFLDKLTELELERRKAERNNQHEEWRRLTALFDGVRLTLTMLIPDKCSFYIGNAIMNADMVEMNKAAEWWEETTGEKPDRDSDEFIETICDKWAKATQG